MDVLDADISINDEATANVAPENEADLMNAVEELTKEKTIIMIAHRLKTVRKDRKSTRLNSSHRCTSRMPSSA